LIRRNTLNMHLSSKSPLFFALCSTLVLAPTGCVTDNPTPRHPEEPAPSTPPVPSVSPTPESVANKTCAGKLRRASDGLIDDLEDGNEKVAPLGGRDGYWFTSKAENAAIKFPLPTFVTAPGGPSGSKQMVMFTGTTAYKDQWGALVGVGFLASGALYDASKYAGIGFKIRGSKAGLNVRLKVPDEGSLPEGGVCKECWNSFGKELILTTEWQDVALTWSELTQQPDWGSPRPLQINPAKVKNVEWSLYPGVEFDFTLDDVHFLECE
jgi:hypothetical protein